jgi:transcriptional regulator with XRE-family HTH domain
MKKNFAIRIKELRLENELSQASLAQMTNVSQQTIAAWERGIKPNIDTLLLLADIFKVSVDYLLGRTNKKGIVLSVDEIKKRFPELADKLDALEIDYLNWEADISEEQLIRIAHRTLDRAIKKMKK